MRTAVLVYAGSISERALAPLAGGKSAFDRVLDFARSIPDLQGTIVLEGAVDLPDRGVPRHRRPAWTDLGILDEALGFCSSLAEPPEALLFVRADEPLLDPALALRMIENYRKYRAEYSFADGYPLGLGVEIVHPRILPALRALAERSPLIPERGWLFAVIQRDINAFDIETEISPRDLRDRRICLSCDTKRNSLLVERLIEAGVKDAPSALEIIPARPELLRTLPAFVGIQVSGGCPQACALCPWPRVGGDILARRDFFPAKRFDALMGGLADYAGDALVDLSLWGEPSFHPDFPSLVSSVLSRPGLSLIVETSGIGWAPGILESIASSHQDSIDWIVSLDAATPETYARLRGEGWSEALGTVERLFGLWPGRVHPQLLRSKENEEELEAFWRGWKKRSDNVIVQKYSRFAGLLPELKVADLSPLARKPCWHLMRDISILIDGSVPPCREILEGGDGFGNVFEGLPPDSVGQSAFFSSAFERIWKSGEAWHAKHVASTYPEPCKICDEFYTFNA
ncbi:MAG: spiro-SPASM protein [Spirochaetota bacterium]